MRRPARLPRLYGRDGAASAKLRQMYVGGRGDATARAYARFWGWVFGAGLSTTRWVTLEVPGRRTGQLTRFPLGIARLDGQEYLVSMLGECNWTRNVHAHHGVAVLRHRRDRAVRLHEVPVEQRAPLIRAYLQQVPGGRPHIPVSPDAPVESFHQVAPRIPVFRLETLRSGGADRA